MLQRERFSFSFFSHLLVATGAATMKSWSHSWCVYMPLGMLNCSKLQEQVFKTWLSANSTATNRWTKLANPLEWISLSASSDAHEGVISISGLTAVTQQPLMQVKSVWLEELFIIDNIKARSRTAENLFSLPDAFSKPAWHVNCRDISRT